MSPFHLKDEKVRCEMKPKGSISDCTVFQCPLSFADLASKLQQASANLETSTDTFCAGLFKDASIHSK